MDWKQLPPMAALRAFSAFAQSGNVQAAGDALGVSHAAISQQLRVLEKHLDVALLDRSGRSMRLTPAVCAVLTFRDIFESLIRCLSLRSNAKSDVGCFRFIPKHCIQIKRPGIFENSASAAQAVACSRARV